MVMMIPTTRARARASRPARTTAMKRAMARARRAGTRAMMTHCHHAMTPHNQKAMSSQASNVSSPTCPRTWNGNHGKSRAATLQYQHGIPKKPKPEIHLQTLEAVHLCITLICQLSFITLCRVEPGWLVSFLCKCPRRRQTKRPIRSLRRAYVYTSAACLGWFWPSRHASVLSSASYDGGYGSWSPQSKFPGH